MPPADSATPCTNSSSPIEERSIPAARGHKTVKKLLIELLHLSNADAGARVAAAQDLGTWHTPTGQDLPVTLPDTAAAQRDGEIGADHARTIRNVIRKIPDAVPAQERALAETTLARLATTATPEDVDRVGDRILAHLDPDGTLPDERDRTRRRGLTLTRQDRAGMSTLTGCLTPTARAMLDAVLAKWARPGMNNPTDPDSPTGTGDSVAPAVLAAAAARDTRTEAQRNHDAFEAMARVLLETGTLGTHRGLPVTVLVTMSLDQLEHAAGGVATTATGGTLPIADALHLARRAHPVLVVFDHHGRPLHLGRERRLASADQRLALIAADGGCTRPGCDAPASRCAVHHVEDWAKGGRTDIDHLALACDACHAQVNDGPFGWTTITDPTTGRTAWIPPARIDPTQTPEVNYRHHPDQLLDRARRQQHEEPPVTTTSPDPRPQTRHAPPPERPARTPILTPPTHPPPTSRRTPPPSTGATTSPRRPRPSTNPQEDTNHPTGHGGTIRQSHPQPSNTQEANNNQPHQRQRLQPPKADRTASPPGKTHALTTPPTSTPDRQETTNRTPGVAAGEDPSPASVRIDRLEHLLLQRPPPPVIGYSRPRALRSRAAKSCRSGPWAMPRSQS